MTTDEKGYIQFTCDWDPDETVDTGRISSLIRWRRFLYEEQLVGEDANGVGFGNMSERIGTEGFVITATQTGHLPHLDGSHFAHVTAFDISENRVSCYGAIRASSESLSHAILYQAEPGIGAVIHVHDAESWARLKGHVPTTAPHAEAGTVAMADEINRLMTATDLRQTKVLVMGGHKDGLMSFGRDIAEAGEVMLKACGRSIPSEHDSAQVQQ